jgi:AraC-like DNA-binding protein
VGKIFDPSQKDFTPQGFACARWTPRPMPRPNRHNEIELTFLTSGSLTYLLGPRTVTMRAGRLAAFWAAIPHQIVSFEGDEDFFAAVIPLAWVLECELPAAFTARLLRGDVVAEADTRNAPLDGALFPRWTADLEQDEIDRRRTVLLEMEARLRRLAEATRPAGAAARDRGAGLAKPALGRVERMAIYIAQNYTSRLAADDIARAAGVHPNYAMTLFRKAFGVSLVDYLTQQRIAHAQRLLITTDDKVLNVALSSGFNSISRFNEAFGRSCGCSPRQFRSQHRRA